jgi:uncharacterized membrane protein
MIKSSIDSSSSVLDRLIPEVVFAVLATIFGFGLVFINAPFEVPDEASHFWRAYHVYEGNLLSSRPHDFAGGWIPKSIGSAHLPFENLVTHPENRVDRQALSNGLQEPFNPADQVFTPMGFAALYAPIVYIPQVIGIATGRLCGLSALHMMYLGRIANLLCWIAVIYSAIRVTPVFKWVFVLVALLPMNLFLAASLSADAAADGIVSLLFAFVLRAVWQEKVLTWAHMLAITLLCVLLAFVKLPYVPLTALVLLIPIARFNGLRNKLLFCGGTIGLSFIAVLIWSAAIKGLYTPLHGANAPEQMVLLKSNFWAFPALAVRSFMIHRNGIVMSFMGHFGFLDTLLPVWVYYTYPVMLTTVALFDSGHDGSISRMQRCWIGLLCVGVFFLVELSMYLTWTPPGKQIIEGVQGRYFLPIAVPTLLALFYNQRFSTSKKRLFALSITFYSLVVLTVMCWTVYNRYFGPAV